MRCSMCGRSGSTAHTFIDDAGAAGPFCPACADRVREQREVAAVAREIARLEARHDGTTEDDAG